MYNDFRITCREGWQFVYRGEQLLEVARAKYVEIYNKENTARQELAKLMKDMSVSTTDSRIKLLKEDVERNGNLREQCAVWINEFLRTPKEIFKLELGDVVFFDLVDDEILPHVE